MRTGPGRNSRSGKQRIGPKGSGIFRDNPPGSKVARKAIEHAGRDWDGEIFHGGELTKAARRRTLERLGFQTIAISE